MYVAQPQTYLWGFAAVSLVVWSHWRLCSGERSTARDHFLFGGVLALALLTYDVFAVLAYLIAYTVITRRSVARVLLPIAGAVFCYILFGMLTAPMTSMVHDRANSKYLWISVNNAIAVLRANPISSTAYKVYAMAAPNYIANLASKHGLRIPASSCGCGGFRVEERQGRAGCRSAVASERAELRSSIFRRDGISDLRALQLYRLSCRLPAMRRVCSCCWRIPGAACTLGLRGSRCDRHHRAHPVDEFGRVWASVAVLYVLLSTPSACLGCCGVAGKDTGPAAWSDWATSWLRSEVSLLHFESLHPRSADSRAHISNRSSGLGYVSNDVAAAREHLGHGSLPVKTRLR